MLDYGCAEGAITAALGKQLGLPPTRILGADVRTIPSLGFTFMPLAAEETVTPPALGTILPDLQDGSVDLITSAMVFHHVTHIEAVLLELRRVVSPSGALVIREHHCVSADMGAFLDITHGLYSLSWSSPVEWPDFISEYKAYYRSREEWDALLKKSGFILCLEECGPQGTSNYHAAEFAKQKPNGFFPNVIKAYYATYKPDPHFRLPVVAAAPSSSLKRSLPETETNPTSKRPSTAIKAEENQVYESSKYPGKFYRISKTTGATEWI
jgi:SAM-dependent methyltransferase